MKSFNMILMGVLAFASPFAFAEDAVLSSTHESMVKELKLEELKLDELIQANVSSKPEAMIKALSSDVSTRAISADSPAAMTINKLYGYHNCLIVVPISQGFSFIDGARCHVGTYLKSTIITVMEGPNYGCQLTVSNYTGQIICINPAYLVEFTPGGVIFRHEYNDSTVVTGYDQVVFVYQ